jgi:hypothetical protein
MLPEMVLSKMEHPIIPETYSAIGMNKLWVALMVNKP